VSTAALVATTTSGRARDPRQSATASRIRRRSSSDRSLHAVARSRSRPVVIRRDAGAQVTTSLAEVAAVSSELAAQSMP